MEANGLSQRVKRLCLGESHITLDPWLISHVKGPCATKGKEIGLGKRRGVGVCQIFKM